MRTIRKPIYGSLQSLQETDLGLIPQVSPSPSDVRLRMPDISHSGICMLGIQFATRERGKRSQKVIQRVPLTRADIEHHPLHAAGLARKQVGIDDVFNKREVTRLLPIPVDARPLPCQCRLHKT